VTGKTLRADIFKIIAWIAVLPALACWPLLSALPAVTVYGGAGGIPAVTVQILLFATGFWGFATLAVLFRFLSPGSAMRLGSTVRSQKGLLIGCWATVWSAFYLIVTFVGR
jgi:hypothetical protein